MAVSIEERVDSLEAVLGHFIASTGASLNRLEREMREFKDEMREFKDEMRVFKDEMRVFKDEMRVSKNEMHTFKDGTFAIIADMNRKWGELANKMGTIVEDIVAPNIPTIASKYFGVDLEFFAVRIRKEHPHKKGIYKEFDAFSVGGGKIFYNETKSTPRTEYMESFSTNRAVVYEYFPEYRDKAIIPIFSSLGIPEDAVAYLTKQNIFAMAMAGNTMELLNFEEIARQKAN